MTQRTRETPDGGGLDPMLRPIALEKLHNGVADYDASFELINRYSAGSPYYGKGFRAGQWFETSSNVYWYFLECLPPLHQTGGGFVVSECTLGGLYESFFEIDGRYYCAVLDWSGPRSFSDLWSALIAEVRP